VAKAQVAVAGAEKERGESEQPGCALRAIGGLPEWAGVDCSPNLLTTGSFVRV